jgi:uncharacterized protein YndB with AHSA1/START domain
MTEVGRTRHAGFQIGVRRTVPASIHETWSALTSPEGLAAWLGSEVSGALETGARLTTADGAHGELRSVRPDDRLRLRLDRPERHAPTTMQVALVPAATGTTIVLHEELLDDAEEREERRAHWRTVADALESVVARHAAGS